MKIKICGLTKVKEAEYLNKNHVDYAGFVLYYPKSKRNMSITDCAPIIKALNSSIKKVAVVVSPNISQVRAINEAGFDVIQVHGKLEKEVYDAIAIDVWKAFNVKDMDSYPDFKDLIKIRGFVFDSAEPGSGKAFDHDLLQKIERRADKQFILAGGINADNVADAILQINPDVIDVSSSVEFTDKPGKEPAKIDEFVEAVDVALNHK